MKQPRLKDVAEAAGVHVATASRALDDRRATMVRPETVERVRTADPKRPVVFITAHGTTETAIEAMKRGAFDYRSKPLPPSLELLRALNAWVAAQVEPLADGLDREVQLRDAPDAAPRRVTVAEVLRQEVEHAAEHRQDMDRLAGRPGAR